MFESFFLRMSYIVHPTDLPGEARDKSCNESWAAKQISRYYGTIKDRDCINITVMDGLYQRFTFASTTWGIANALE